MAPSLDLRKSPKPAAPAAPKAVAVAPFDLGMPLAPGTVLSLTDDEKAGLESVGWVEGEPIPNIGAAVAELQRAAPATLVDPGRAALPMPEIVPLQDLPQEARDRLIAGIQEMRESGARLEALQKQQVTQPGGAGINETIAAVAGGNEQFHVTLGKRDAAAPQAAAPAPAEPAAEPAAPSPTGGSEVRPHVCPRCQFVGKESDLTAPTDEDKRNFLTMMLGGGRLIKTYDVLGGAMQISFRSLTQVEMDMTLQQATCDQLAGRIPPAQSEFFRAMANYEMILGLHEIRRPTGTVTMPEIAAVQWTPAAPGEPHKTALADYSQWMYDEHLTTGALLRLLSTMHARFNDTIRRMEANVSTPDFWKGIVMPR